MTRHSSYTVSDEDQIKSGKGKKNTVSFSDNFGTSSPPILDRLIGAKYVCQLDAGLGRWHQITGPFVTIPGQVHLDIRQELHIF